MDKSLAVELIQNFIQKPLPNLINRDLETPQLLKQKANIIIGPRRAGKTYFLFNVIQRMNKEKNQMLYINLEDDRLLPLTPNDMDLLLKTYYEIYPETKDTSLYLFLDEVQNLQEWERFVRRILDTENIFVFLTGSSSNIFTTEIATHMRGRSLSYTILPFTFEEFLRSKDKHPGKHPSTTQRSWTLKLLSEYLTFGGFPEITLVDSERTKIKILREYVEVMLLRDIIERHAIHNIKVLRMLFSAIIESFSKTFSVHKFYNSLNSQGIKVSKNTLYDYLYYLEDAYVVLPVKRFSYSHRKIKQSLPKTYLMDNGYILQHRFRPTEDTGRLMENVVAIELFHRKKHDPRYQFFYWKNPQGIEVDFIVVKENRSYDLIQVAYDIDKKETHDREISALLKASESINTKNLHIISWDTEKQISINEKKIHVIPLWKWLLNENK